MDLQKLQELYPQGNLVDEASKIDSKMFIVRTKGGLFTIDQSKISEREQLILGALLETAESSDFSWKNYLNGVTNAPSKEKPVRIIQFTLEKNNASLDVALVLKKLKKIPEAVFFQMMSSDYGVVIERLTRDALSAQQLEKLFKEMEEELGQKIYFFIGNFYDTDQPISPFFIEEAQLFRRRLEYDFDARGSSATGELILQVASSSIENSSIRRYFKQKLSRHEQLKEIVECMWSKDASLTRASRELYMHRNTLQYKINQINETLGFNLKHLPDLFYCYIMLEQIEN